MDDRLHALNRFGLGARPGDVDRMDDPRAWLVRQLDRSAPLSGSDLEEIADVVEQQRKARDLPEQERAAARRALRDLVVGEATGTLSQRYRSDTPFIERLVTFWSNHLCVSAAANPAVAALAGHYERTAIRPHVLGRYEEMLLASARHPAMLAYLDNARSIGPNSRGARMAGRRQRSGGQPRGLNENYARELLELHTVGVDGGYTQADVEQLARILTGWTVDLGGGRMRRQGPSRPLHFRFAPELHEPGSKKLMGITYREGGEQEGVLAIRALARHPMTARFLGEKLARHFIGDEPPAAAAGRLAGVFLDTGGDLRRVALALVESPEAWDAQYHKFRTPQDWLVASFRALGVTDAAGPQLEVLRALRQPLWGPPAPKGYDDLTRSWADPDALMNRAELARTISRRVAGRDGDPAQLRGVVSPGGSDALDGMLQDASIDRTERVALALASPDFQWR